MRNLFVFLLIDCSSEGIIHSFIAPNCDVAKRMFRKWINAPELKDSIEPKDFVLVQSHPVEVYDCFSSYVSDEKDEKMDFVCYGDEVY